MERKDFGKKEIFLMHNTLAGEPYATQIQLIFTPKHPKGQPMAWQWEWGVWCPLSSNSAAQKACDLLLLFEVSSFQIWYLYMAWYNLH